MLCLLDDALAAAVQMILARRGREERQARAAFVQKLVSLRNGLGDTAMLEGFPKTKDLVETAIKWIV